MNEYQAKLKSLGFSRRKGTTKERKVVTDTATIVQTEHWDDRKDAKVIPHAPIERVTDG